MHSTKTLLTAPELATLINVRESMVRQLCFKKAIPFIKIGRLVRFEKEEIVKWIDKKKFFPK